MKYALIILIPLLFTACTEDEMNSTVRAVDGAYRSYHNRPAPTGYYQPVAQPTPAYPYYPYGY